jgi:uncharacterized protein (DUF608 family)
MPDIFHQLDEMNLDELKQVMDYIKQRKENLVKMPTINSDNASSSERIPGLHAHLDGFWMSDDFDDELPDSLWLGEAVKEN